MRQIYQNFAVDPAGNVISGASITVRDSNGDLATLYADETGSTQAYSGANPFTAGDGSPDAEGWFSFWADVPEDYTLTVGTGGSAQEYKLQFFQDPRKLIFDTEADFIAADLTSFGNGATAIVRGQSYVKVSGATNFIKDDWEPVYFETVADFLASNQPSRGVGKITRASWFSYREVASNGMVQNAAGVHFDVIPGKEGYNALAWGIDNTGITAIDTLANSMWASVKNTGINIFYPAGQYAVESGVDFTQDDSISGFSTQTDILGSGDESTIFFSRNAPAFVIKVDARYFSLRGIGIWGSQDQIRDSSQSAAIGLWLANARETKIENFRIAHIVGTGLRIDRCIVSRIDGIVYRCGSDTARAVDQTNSDMDGCQASWVRLSVEDGHGSLGVMRFLSHRNTYIEAKLENQAQYIIEVNNPVGRALLDETITFSGGATATVALTSGLPDNHPKAQLIIKDLNGTFTTSESFSASGGATGDVAAFTASTGPMLRLAGDYGTYRIRCNQNPLRTTGAEVYLEASDAKSDGEIYLRGIHQNRAVEMSGSGYRLDLLSIEARLNDVANHADYDSALYLSGSDNLIKNYVSKNSKGIEITSAGDNSRIETIDQTELYGQALSDASDGFCNFYHKFSHATYVDPGIGFDHIVRLTGTNTKLATIGGEGTVGQCPSGENVFNISGDDVYVGPIDVTDAGSASIVAFYSGSRIVFDRTQLAIPSGSTGFRGSSSNSEATMSGVKTSGGAIGAYIQRSGDRVIGGRFTGYSTRAIQALPGSAATRLAIVGNTCLSDDSAVDDIRANSANITDSQILDNNVIDGADVITLTDLHPSTKVSGNICSSLGNVSDQTSLQAQISLNKGEFIDLKGASISITSELTIPSNGVKLRNGSLVAATTDFSLVDLGAGRTLELENVTLEDFQTVVELDGSGGAATVPLIRLKSCVLTDCERAIWVSADKANLTLTKVELTSNKMTGGQLGFSCDCNVTSADVRDNEISGLTLPSSASFANANCFAINIGYPSTSTTFDLIAKNNRIYDIDCQHTSADCNGIRFLGERAVISDNIIRNLSTSDSNVDNCEGIYGYANQHQIINNILSDAGRNQGSIALKGPEGSSLYSNIKDNLIEYPNSLTDDAPGIMISCDYVKVESNTLINSGAVDGSRGFFGAIQTDKTKTLNHVEISKNTILTRGIAGILLRHNGTDCLVSDNKIELTGAMDSDNSEDWAAIHYLSEGDTDLTLAGLKILRNEVKMTSNAGGSRDSFGILMTNLSGSGRTTFSDIRIESNIWDADIAYEITPANEFTIENAVFARNNYLNCPTIYARNFATMAGSLTFEDEFGMSFESTGTSLTELFKIPLPDTGILTGKIELTGRLSDDLLFQSHEFGASCTSGTATIEGTNSGTEIASSGASTWNTSVLAGGNDVRFMVQGAASVKWQAKFSARGGA